MVGNETDFEGASPPARSQPVFRFMRDGEESAVLEVIRASFGDQWPKIPINVDPLDHLKWKFATPKAAPEESLVVELDGRIIGFLGRGSRDVWVRSQRYPGWFSGDYCVHPDYQSLGLTHDWSDWSGQYNLGLPIRPEINEGSTHPRLRADSTRPEQRMMVANEVDLLTLQLRRTRFPWNRAADGRSWLVRPLLRAARLYGKLAQSRLRRPAFRVPRANVTMRSVESFDERADHLWNVARLRFDFAVARDSAYLNWRYCDPRAGIYHVRAAEDGDNLAGWAVVASQREDAEIVDLLAVPRELGVVRALIEDAIEVARRDGAGSLSVLMPKRHAWRDTFLAYGFIASRLPKPMGFGRLREPVLDFLAWDERARLHITVGDSDHI